MRGADEILMVAEDEVSHLCGGAQLESDLLPRVTASFHLSM